MKRVESAARWILLGVPALLAVAAGAVAEGERTPSIRAVMHKQYRVTRAPFVVIKKEMASEAPDWAKVKEATETFLLLGTALGKNEPNWGDPDSWKRFTALHLSDARAMDDAAGAHDREALRAVHRRLETACNACHNAHRSRPRP